MAEEKENLKKQDVPWPQQLLDSEWVLALAAILFFMLSYVVWGLIDILSIPAG